MRSDRVRLAVLDMNNNVPNQGLRCIKDIVKEYDSHIDWRVFDVRSGNELPDLSYDIYISSGGPGNPMDNGIWKQPYLDLVDQAWQMNQSGESVKKYFFFICLSFQVVCEHFELGQITSRKSTSFGVLPVHKTKAGRTDPVLDELPDPYYAVDSRDYQLVQPRLKVFEEHGAKILSLEKIRTHVEYERAIMAVRFSDEFFGTQYHPEADAEGMKAHFSSPEMKEKVINNIGEKKYKDMMEHLDDPEKIELTHRTIIPRFIEMALSSLKQQNLALQIK